MYNFSRLFANFFGQTAEKGFHYIFRIDFAAAVNRMIGVTVAGIIASVSSRYAITSLIGVAISFITIRFLKTSAAFAKSEFAYFATLPIKTVVIVIIIAVLISVICGTIPVLRILAKKDLSNEVK